VQARVLAFVCILVAGLAGAAIGGSVAKIECHGSCTTPTGLGAVAGGAAGAGGTALVASLTLRAMGEWKRISNEELEAEDMPGGVRLGGPAERIAGLEVCPLRRTSGWKA